MKGKPILMFEKQNQCQEIELHDDFFFSLVDGFDGVFSFRGQSNVEWGLSTTYERFIANNTKGISGLDIEQRLIDRFAKAGHSLLQKEGITFDDLEELDKKALVQHYGGPTRMLDFTDSFLHATAFAILDNCIRSSAVIGIRRLVTDTNSDANDYMRNLLLKYSAKGQIAPSVQIPEPTQDDMKLQTYFANKPCLRNIHQNGHFIVPSVVDIPFEKVLANNLGLPKIEFQKNEGFKDRNNVSEHQRLQSILEKTTVVKIVISEKIKRAVRNRIFKTVSMLSLFPDLTGVAMSLYQIDTGSI
jgi:hypothetical protein